MLMRLKRTPRPNAPTPEPGEADSYSTIDVLAIYPARTADNGDIQCDAVTIADGYQRVLMWDVLLEDIEDGWLTVTDNPAA